MSVDYSAAQLVRARRAILDGAARKMREALGLSQSDIAHELGVTPGAVAHWDTNRRFPKAPLAVAYVSLLETLTAANGNGKRHIDGTTLTELDERGDDLSKAVNREIRYVLQTIVDEAGDEITEDDLNRLNTLWPEAVARLMPKLAEAFTDSARKVKDQLDTAQDALTAAVDDVPNVVAEQYLEQARNRLAGISDVVWEQAREQLHEGFTQGESIRELAARLTDRTPELASPRADVIARTEVVGASNQGSLAQMAQLGLTYEKTWIATNDDRTRDTHKRADGQTVPSNEPFRIGRYEMNAPHDSRGPAEEVVNCRCSVSFEIPDDELAATVPDLPRGDDAYGVASEVPDLTDDQERTLLDYTGPNYTSVNGMLRTTDGNLTESTLVKRIDPDELNLRGELYPGTIQELHDVRDQVAALDRIFGKTKPLSRDIETYRGVFDVEDLFGPEGTWAGKTFRDPGYLSMSTSRDVAERFATRGRDTAVVKLRVPSGTPALNVSKATKGFRSEAERELLLPRGSRFSITGVSGNRKDGWQIEAVLE